MSMLSLYPGIPSKSAFLHDFNEDQMGMARKFLSQLDTTATISFIFMILLAAVIAYYYYKPFCNQPGRHYKMKYWVIFMGVSIIACGLATFGFEMAFIHTKLDGAGKYELFMVLDNAVYSIIPYLITSCIMCNIKTCAYPMFKIK